MSGHTVESDGPRSWYHMQRSQRLRSVFINHRVARTTPRVRSTVVIRRLDCVSVGFRLRLRLARVAVADSILLKQTLSLYGRPEVISIIGWVGRCDDG